MCNHFSLLLIRASFGQAKLVFAPPRLDIHVWIPCFSHGFFLFWGVPHISSRFKFACRVCSGLGVGFQQVVGFHLAWWTVERCEVCLAKNGMQS